MINVSGRVSFLHGELLDIPYFPDVQGHGAALLACSAELSLHSRYHQFSPFHSTPAKLKRFPKCLSATGGEVSGVPPACGAPRGVSMGREGCGQWLGDAGMGWGPWVVPQLAWC